MFSFFSSKVLTKQTNKQKTRFLSHQSPRDPSYLHFGKVPPCSQSLLFHSCPSGRTRGMWEMAFISSLSFHLWAVSSSPRSWSETMGRRNQGCGVRPEKGPLPEETAHWSWRNLTWLIRESTCCYWSMNYTITRRVFGEKQYARWCESWLSEYL